MTGDARLNADFMGIIAEMLPDDIGEVEDDERNVWFVFGRQEAERYLLVGLRDIISGGGEFGMDLDAMDEGLRRDFQEVYLALYMVMTNRARTIAMTYDGRVVPWGITWRSEDRSPVPGSD